MSHREKEIQQLNYKDIFHFFAENEMILSYKFVSKSFFRRLFGLILFSFPAFSNILIFQDESLLQNLQSDSLFNSPNM